MKPRRRLHKGLLAAVAALVAAPVLMAAWLATVNGRGPAQGSRVAVLQPGPQQDPALVARGRELSLIGHCAACHTAPGGPAYAGGHAVLTPFGTVYGGNLTPDVQTGLGQWTSEDFWRALHNGQSRDGRWLNPAFPYENFSHIRREDSDALYAYLQSLPPVQQRTPAHSLRFPANTQLGLAIWRALYFRPPEPTTAAQMDLGEYLGRGLAHCSACHATRNALGAQSATHDFSGQLLPGGRAYAPPLPPSGHADSGAWTVEDMVAYLKTGHSRQGAALGLMAQVVAGSTQHVDAAQLRALSSWILQQPAPAPRAASRSETPESLQGSPVMVRGEGLYAEHCAACHGEHGRGFPGMYPALAGNPRVARDPATNLIRIIQEGGFGPATEGHPRPFGMPPFGHVLQPHEVAAVATYIRRQWNGADLPEVTPLQVIKPR